jgi:hypothetical protein
VQIEVELALASLEARVCLADYVDAAFAANDLTIRMTIFQRFDGGYNFHNKFGKTVEKGGLRLPCQYKAKHIFDKKGNERED